MIFEIYMMPLWEVDAMFLKFFVFEEVPGYSFMWTWKHKMQCRKDLIILSFSFIGLKALYTII